MMSVPLTTVVMSRIGIMLIPRIAVVVVCEVRSINQLATACLLDADFYQATGFV